MVAGLHEQTDTPRLQDPEPGKLQQGAQASRSLTIWFAPAMTWEGAPNGKRGRQFNCSDAAIQTCLTMKVLFGMVPV